MRKFIIIEYIFISLVCVYCLLYFFEQDYILKAIYVTYLHGHSTAYIEDYVHFKNSEIKASSNPQPWPLHNSYNTHNLSDEQEKFLLDSRTIAYLVIKNDSILYEAYFDGFDEVSKVNSFSITKSYISALLGIALRSGYVDSLQQPVKDFLPGLTGKYADRVTMEDLVSMSSGLDWDEDYYFPLNVTTASYFTTDLKELMYNIPINNNPGQVYNYQSGAIQLLSMALAQATKKSLTAFIQESIWEPLGYEQNAYWPVDSERKHLEKGFCCIASNARDFVRLAKLYKDYGKWNGQQIIDSSYVVKSLTPRFENGKTYGYSFWLKEYDNRKTFMMRGHLGQYVIVFPEEDLIVVRLGHKKHGEEVGDFNSDVDVFMEMGLNINGSDLEKSMPN